MGKKSLTPKIGAILRNRDFLLMLALALGLGAGGGARYMEKAVLPALAVVMTLATMGVPGKIFLSPRGLISPLLVGLAMNYGILSGFLLGASALWVCDPGLSRGFILMAAAPPAVAVIPFTVILKGNTPLSLGATIGCYLGALLLMPLISVVGMGEAFGDPEKLVRIMLELILAPLVASRILIKIKAVPRLEPYRGAVTNWSFFIVVYTIVGLNREFILQEPSALMMPALIALMSTFGLGAAIEFLARLFRVNRATTTSLVLLGTHKNTGLSAGLSLTLFSEWTAVPSTISTIFMLVYLVWLNLKHTRYAAMDT